MTRGTRRRSVRQMTKHEAKDHLNKLLSDGNYSDITVKWRKKSWNLHKAPLSKYRFFFEAAFRNPPNKKTLEFEDDEAEEAISVLLHYIYFMKYPTVDPPAETTKNKEPSPDTPDTPTPMNTRLSSARRQYNRKNPLFHAKVYNLAENYGVPSLKALAADNFYNELQKHYDNERSVECLGKVFEGSLPHDTGLRRTVAALLDMNMELMHDSKVQEAIEKTGSAMDILVLMADRRERHPRNRLDRDKISNPSMERDSSFDS
ncbi:hypothetical protein S7711_01983 [Stachybotrys chartarum IBT 7711]|uniref:BTB domain-containing protein n=1 Tax=Stachybotrys chartarum (strain CBS 109288 / IBT 7711) TaxID=1280523 RepID=A0A084AN18_STACB|nr:hypothetical protein S7711_01983 [Stachybotrys chartarum IBT 7711]